MKVYIVRHGETLENAGKRLMGREHGVLSELGKEQATKTGEYLKDQNISVIYSSPLNRCLDTAKLINVSLGLKISEHDSLIERDFGKFTNAKYDEVDFDNIDNDTEENKLAGIETLSAIEQRVKSFLQEIWKAHREDTIAIITHNNPIRFFLAHFLNKTQEEIYLAYKIKNCSINVFETEDGENYRQIVVDDIMHLK